MMMITRIRARCLDREKIKGALTIVLKVSQLGPSSRQWIRGGYSILNRESHLMKISAVRMNETELEKA
jgi:hypothetical protein